jgi:protein tyrosine phosphatase
MNFIENVGAADIPSGNHFACGENAMLIQISDPESKNTRLYTTPWFPVPKHQFKEVHQFSFMDIEDDDVLAPEFGITDAQAAELVRLLQHALEHRMNVVVHCFAGICRSGAVVEVATMLGFVDPGRFRLPNMRVKRKMMEVLGLTYKNEPVESTDEIINRIYGGK